MPEFNYMTLTRYQNIQKNLIQIIVKAMATNVYVNIVKMDFWGEIMIISFLCFLFTTVLDFS